MATFNGLDYAIFILLFLSVAWGVCRGFVKEIISLLAWVAAFVVSTLYAVKFAALFPNLAGHASGPAAIGSVSLVAIIVSYLVLFIGTLILGAIIKAIVNHFSAGAGLSLLNRLLGALFGLCRGCLIALLAIFFITFTSATTHSLWKDSKLIAVFHPGVKWLDKLAQPYLAEIQAKMKKASKSMNQDDLTDVIKAKSMTVAPAATAPELMPDLSAPANAAPALKVPAAAPAPAVSAPAAAPAVAPAPVPAAALPAPPESTQATPAAK